LRHGDYKDVEENGAKKSGERRRHLRMSLGGAVARRGVAASRRRVQIKSVP